MGNYSIFQLPTSCEIFLPKIIKIQWFILELQLKMSGVFLWDRLVKKIPNIFNSNSSMHHWIVIILTWPVTARNRCDVPVLINVLLCGAIHSYTNFSGRGTAAIARGGGGASSSVLYGWPCYARPTAASSSSPTPAGCGVRSLFCYSPRLWNGGIFNFDTLHLLPKELGAYLGNEHTALSSIAALFHCGGRRRRSLV